ncbi:MAG TPA: DUF2627 domain-containing protein [Bacillales bacterium]|nr:DUF2627 domain-containing protein [Bacillales bacterium]
MRLIAWLILIIPGLLAGYGIKWMRDTFFNELSAIFPYLWVQFLCGSAAFLFGMSFIGGFLMFREKKKRQNRKKDG